ncbi:MAG TPA: DUF349 domain-containing protein [Cyclobacteriaceae bacterium]|nr:DUF349 domain-containing protein [Cyclobacteriaceae bacterium]
MENDKEMSEEHKVTQQIAENETARTVEQMQAHSAEEREEHEDHAEHTVDYSGLSKKQLLEEMRELLRKADYLHTDAQVNELRSVFDEIFEKEKEEALQHFVAEGGTEDDFEYRKADEDKEFFYAFNEFKKRRAAALKDLEQSRDKNLHAKNQILERLREIVDGEETTDSISTIKKIQEEWKSIGPVPASQNKNIWASYNALMDRYYDNRSIYFELKELDKKKNLESKLELCAKAEALLEVEDLKEAIRQLNELHEEFKHIGPVPSEEQEALWLRFKAASDAVYLRRKDYFEEQKEVYKRNLEVKEGLIKKLESLQDFKGDRIREWNSKTKEVLDIQKEWESVGPVPKENGKEINRTFWGYFKRFFHNKNQFFKELDELRLVNKGKAEALISEAEALMNSTDWQNSSNRLIKLQDEWRQLGPTPEKVRNELYRRFKAACDTFFENRRQANKEATKEYEANLKAKMEICDKIIQESKSDNPSPDRLEELIQAYNAIGFVPRKNIKEAASRFNEAVEGYIAKLGDGGLDLDDFLFRLNLNKLQADPNSNRVLNKKEHGIRKQIADLENNITLWKNNLEFFAASRTADKLKNQFDEKIEKAEQEVEKLKKRLSIIREF